MIILNKLRSIIILLMIVFCGSCDSKREALGSSNEIRVICSELDEPIIRDYLSSIFTDTLFTPEPEPYYYLKFSDPLVYNELNDQSKVVVAAVARDEGNSGYQLVKKLLPPNQFKETELGDPVILAKDVNARNQLFMIINAMSVEQLFATVESKKDFIRKQFYDLFVERQSRYIFGDDRNKKLEDSLKTEFGWSMKIPWGWTKIKANFDSQFVWLGAEMPFQWIGIGWEDGNLVDNELEAGEYIWDWPKSHYGFIQFHDYKFKLNQTPYGNSNAFRADGIWETINVKKAKGGPFRSYVFYDENNDKTYHINYLIHHPGNDKSIFMRKLDLVVKTFKIEFE